MMMSKIDLLDWEELELKEDKKKVKRMKKKRQRKANKKKKRVVRGVGAAKRGYGKATYSKKMY